MFVEVLLLLSDISLSVFFSQPAERKHTNRPFNEKEKHSNSGIKGIKWLCFEG